MHLTDWQIGTSVGGSAGGKIFFGVMVHDCIRWIDELMESKKTAMKN